MTWQMWLAFFGAAIAIAVSPGAGAVQSMATGLAHGVRRGSWWQAARTASLACISASRPRLPRSSR